MSEKIDKNIWYGKCGCGWLVTDYPFMSCTVCGYIGCGSKKELATAKKIGKLIQWTHEKPNVPSSEIRDSMLPDEPLDEDEWYEEEYDFEEEY